MLKCKNINQFVMQIKIILYFCLFIFNIKYCSLSLSAHCVSAQAYSYINKFKTLAIAEMIRTGIPASIKLAQGMYESQYGQSPLAKQGNNHFGIKCKEEWKGEVIYQDDDAPQECFRKYKSAHDSYIDHSKILLERDRYAALFDLDSDDYTGWAKGLKQAGYATDPNYDDKIINIIQRFALYKYHNEEQDEKPIAEIPTPTNQLPDYAKQGDKYFTAQSLPRNRKSATNDDIYSINQALTETLGQRPTHLPIQTLGGAPTALANEVYVEQTIRRPAQLPRNVDNSAVSAQVNTQSLSRTPIKKEDHHEDQNLPLPMPLEAANTYTTPSNTPNTIKISNEPVNTPSKEFIAQLNTPANVAHPDNAQIVQQNSPKALPSDANIAQKALTIQKNAKEIEQKGAAETNLTRAATDDIVQNMNHTSITQLSTAEPDISIESVANRTTAGKTNPVKIAEQQRKGSALLPHQNLHYVNNVKSVVYPYDVSIWQISNTYKVAAELLLKYNDLDSENTPLPAKTPIYLQPKKDKAEDVKIHIVQDNETLWQIAQQYALSLSAIWQKNKLDGKKEVRSGEKIYLKGNADTPPKTR